VGVLLSAFSQAVTADLGGQPCPGPIPTIQPAISASIPSSTPAQTGSTSSPFALNLARRPSCEPPSTAPCWRYCARNNSSRTAPCSPTAWCRTTCTSWRAHAKTASRYSRSQSASRARRPIAAGRPAGGASCGNSGTMTIWCGGRRTCGRLRSTSWRTRCEKDWRAISGRGRGWGEMNPLPLWW